MPRHAHYLVARNGVYHFRGCIPVRLRSRFGRQELRLSLRTRNLGTARLKALKGAHLFHRLCSRLEAMETVTQDTIRNAVQEFGRCLLASAPPPPEYEDTAAADAHSEALFDFQEMVTGLEWAIEDDCYEAGARCGPDVDTQSLKWAGQAVRQMEPKFQEHAKMDLAALDPTSRLAVRQGIARVLLEDYKQILHRMRDRLLPYAPADPLFADASNAGPSAHVRAPSPLPDTLLTVAEAVEAFIAAKAGVSWTARTEAEVRRILTLLIEHLGAATPLRAVVKTHVREFRNGMLTWRLKPGPGAKLKDIVGAPDGYRIGAKTAAKHFATITSLFAFCVDEGLLETSPTAGLKVQQAKNKKQHTRGEFSDADLKALFTSPMFRSCAGPTRRMQSGPMKLRDGYYWATLMGPLTGMRITEIVQLMCKDIGAKDDVPIIHVRADVEEGQSVKTDAGWRIVPVHRLLVDLGFLEFVQERAKDGANARLFKDIVLAKTGGGGGEFSKWFGRRLENLGIKRKDLVFHSFRHRFVGEMRELNAPEYVIKSLVGHEGGDTTDGYGAKVSAAVRAQWVNKITYLDEYFPQPI